MSSFILRLLSLKESLPLAVLFAFLLACSLFFCEHNSSYSLFFICEIVCKGKELRGRQYSPVKYSLCKRCQSSACLSNPDSVPYTCAPFSTTYNPLFNVSVDLQGGPHLGLRLGISASRAALIGRWQMFADGPLMMAVVLDPCRLLGWPIYLGWLRSLNAWVNFSSLSLYSFFKQLQICELPSHWVVPGLPIFFAQEAPS